MDGLRNLMWAMLALGGLCTLALVYGALKGAAQAGLAPEGEPEPEGEELPEIF